MKKTLRVATLSNNENIIYEVNAIFHDDTVIYIEQDKNKTKTSFNYAKNQLIRKNEDFTMTYDFVKGKETIGTLIINNIGKTIYLKVKTTDIIKNKDNIKIVFTVENEKIEYKLEMLAK